MESACIYLFTSGTYKLEADVSELRMQSSDVSLQFFCSGMYLVYFLILFGLHCRFILCSMDSNSKSAKQSIPEKKDPWSFLTEETDNEEEYDERGLPAVSGNIKRKRAPRGGSIKRVKLKPLVIYNEDKAGEDTSVSLDDLYLGKEEVKQGSGLSRGEEKPDAEQGGASSKVNLSKLRECGLNNQVTEGGDYSSKMAGRENDYDEVSAHTPRLVFGAKKLKGVLDARPSTPSNPESDKSTSPFDSGMTSNDYDQEDLENALKVLKRIMKMEAAQPFNTPVDPIALGVPDYYDVIETPMDFGTIHNLLERREKYRNAQDVYHDIQLMWSNCRKYNHKGDPILELMKKVQKACSKFWTANGSLRELRKSKKGFDQTVNSQVGEDQLHQHELQETPSPTDNASKARFVIGTSNHKQGCGCVVCMALRRKLAREKRVLGRGFARPHPQSNSDDLQNKLEKQDCVEEQFVDTYEDVLLEGQEDEDGQYRPASYQIPLRKVDPAVLSVGRGLFQYRPGPIWHRRPANPRNPLFVVASALATHAET